MSRYELIRNTKEKAQMELNSLLGASPKCVVKGQSKHLMYVDSDSGEIVSLMLNQHVITPEEAEQIIKFLTYWLENN